MKILTENKKAYHDFVIEETFEAGIVLAGCEIKSLRLGKANLRDSYVIVKNGEVFLLGANISQYDKTTSFVLDPVRTRKLLLNKDEILKLERLTKIKGYSIVATKMFLSNNRAKVEIAVAKGKKLFDKRDSLKEKDQIRDMDRQIREKTKLSKK